MGEAREANRARGVNTFGLKIQSHIDAINEEYAAYQDAVSSIRKYLDERELPGQDKEWDKKRFAFLMMLPYCKERSDKLVPAEFCVAIFSFNEGTVDIHTGIMDPGEIPFGETGEVKTSCETNGYPYPGENVTPVVQPVRFMHMLKTLAITYGLLMDKEFLFFSTRSDIPMIHCCLNWLKSTTGEDKFVARILSFELLLKEMSRKSPNKIGVIEHEGGAGRFIYHTRYDYNQVLACGWHRRGAAADKMDRCACAIALRRVFNALFYLCHLFGRPIEGALAPPATTEKISIKTSSTSSANAPKAPSSSSTRAPKAPSSSSAKVPKTPSSSSAKASKAPSSYSTKG